jgi:hypothetical protein
MKWVLKCTFARRAAITMSLLCACILMVACSGNILIQVPAGAVGNNHNWTDVSGNQIWAQGGWILQDQGTFYWYGLDYSKSKDYPSVNGIVAGYGQIRLYTSTDILSWVDQGAVADLSTIPGYKSSDGLGRVKVAYNSSTKMYVMFSEWDNSSATRNTLLYYSSASPLGPFTYRNFTSLPCGYTMGDLGSVYSDSSGAFLSLTQDNPTRNGSICIAKLAPDYLSISSIVATIVPTGCPNEGGCKEASNLIKVGDNYVLTASDTVGWGSSPTSVFTASNLAGPWAQLGHILTNPSSSNSFNTQHDHIIPIVGNQGTFYLYMGDRWLQFGGAKGLGFYQFSPVTFDRHGVPTLNGDTFWYPNASAGTWSLAPAKIVKR